ncbi:hypothetical protein F9U38_15765 [Pectobacterium versatile]|uniref:hypothetical protein n=1 Tax=Pectobacterium versatile TaxID=2488639 RepID=UPI001B39D02A|nr:hypothetical protein [Pectobacterium versatile]MBQ4781973.1 hypothetical protein [Pectobacterium versatile]MBQ4786433.1 hypothetical protein [Pectobacterium versatile]
MNVKNLTATLLINRWFWVACSALLVLFTIIGIVQYGASIAAITVFCAIGMFVLQHNFKHPAFLPDRYPYHSLYQWFLGLIASVFFIAAWFIGLAYVGPVFAWFAVAASATPAVLNKTLSFWGIEWIR